MARNLAVQIILSVTFFGFPTPSFTQTSESLTHVAAVPEVPAIARSASVTLDGRLDESDWGRARPASAFRQYEPSEGEPATQPTEVRFLFDGEAIYVGARMYDSAGVEGITARLTRRDAELQQASPSDYLRVVFDPYHDHLGAAAFGVNAAGVKHDQLNGDSSWDPVWAAAVRVDSLGWTAELRIPFSQLRYGGSSGQAWGLQVHRRVSRLNEESLWSFWGQNEMGGPSRFGHLTGLAPGTAPARLEVLPYVVGQAAMGPPASDGDPFHREHEQSYRVGVDLKYLLGSNLTVSATFNPDFGQVEVDPAVVNLTAFETFFQEKRPFFVEGRGYFGFGTFWCHFCSNVFPLNLFYSRRIGRSPQGSALAEERSEYADVPENTTIQAAAQLTGRTPTGWTIAVLDAVAANERARLVLEDGSPAELVVEPATNYLVSRVRKDLLGGDLVLGGIVTSTYRALGSDELAQRLSGRAESLGLDAELWWKERTYHFLASLASSQVSGSTEAVRRLQESSARYFQRPDRGERSNGLFTPGYDPDLTHLRGYGFYGRLAKDAGDWRWELAANGRSPGFEVNDIAFLQRSDYVWLNANVQRYWTRPTRLYRRLSLLTGAQTQFNYDGDRTDLQGRVFGYAQLPNYWEVRGLLVNQRPNYDDQLTRGGPVVHRHGFTWSALTLSSDARSAVSFSINPSLTAHAFGKDYGLGFTAHVRPTSYASLTLGPRYDHAVNGYQYVTAREDPAATAFFGRRHVFATVDQRTLAMDTRLDVTFTPTLSLELFAQPFLSSGEYRGFKEFVAPRQPEMRVFGTDAGTIFARGNGDQREYVVDPDGDGPAAEFAFGDPNFNLRSLRGNAVLRWEYRPGSTLFLVWTQNRSGRDSIGDFHLNRDRRALFSAPSNNVFLVKINYWLTR